MDCVASIIGITGGKLRKRKYIRVYVVGGNIKHNGYKKQIRAYLIVCERDGVFFVAYVDLRTVHSEV